MSENKIEVFSSAEFGAVRTLKTEDGKVIFCGEDVAKALGYSNARDALSRHCKLDGGRETRRGLQNHKSVWKNY